MKLRRIVLTVAMGGMVLSAPMLVSTAGGADKVLSNPDLYSDRARSKALKSDEDKLEQALKTGEEKEFYRRELEKMGWQITAVNYDKPDYLEYEIVKGKDSFEVQVDFDKQSHKASKVDVTTNVWKADASKQALTSNKKVAYPNKTTANPTRYSDRDRIKASKSDKEKLEQMLKTGEEKAFYRRELEKMGWKVASVNYDKPDYVEYEIPKYWISIPSTDAAGWVLSRSVCPAFGHATFRFPLLLLSSTCAPT